MDKPKIYAYKSSKIDKVLDKSTEQKYSQKIFVSMARIHSKIEIPRRDFGDILQMIYCILESGATCHMTPDISDFSGITGGNR